VCYYWVVDVTVSFVINECKSCRRRIRKQHSDSDNDTLKSSIVIELTDIGCVFDQEIIDLSILQTNHMINTTLTVPCVPIHTNDITKTATSINSTNLHVDYEQSKHTVTTDDGPKESALLHNIYC